MSKTTDRIREWLRRQLLIHTHAGVITAEIGLEGYEVFTEQIETLEQKLSGLLVVAEAVNHAMKEQLRLLKRLQK